MRADRATRGLNAQSATPVDGPGWRFVDAGRVAQGASFYHDGAQADEQLVGHVTRITTTEYTVLSQTDHSTVYVVTSSTPGQAGGCLCFDSQRNPTQSCKHEWAVNLLMIAERRQRVMDARVHLSEQELRRAVEWMKRYDAASEMVAS